MIYKINSNMFLYPIVLLIWVVTLVIKFRYNGLVFGFDYGLYHPDGALYATRALDWSGYTETEAARLVFSWYESNAYKFNFDSPSELYYANHHLYTEYSPRILYPLLSVPFINIYGIPGLLFVPAISLLVLMLVVAKIGKDLGKSFTAVLVIISLCSSTTVTRWMLANTTDSLLAGIFSLSVLQLSKKKLSAFWIWSIGLLIILTGLTRISVVFWLAIALVLLVQNRRLEGLFVLVFSIIITIPTLLSNSSNSFLVVESQRSLLERLILYPFYLIKIIFYEFAQLFVLDKVLFFMCVLSLFYSFRFFHQKSSKYLVFIFIAGFATGALNGTVGVNFRYQLPVLVFICWSLIDNLYFDFRKFFKFAT